MKRAVSITCAAILLITTIFLAGCDNGNNSGDKKSFVKGVDSKTEDEAGSLDGSYQLVAFRIDGEDSMDDLGDAAITMDISGDTAIMSGMKELNGNDSQVLKIDATRKIMTDEENDGAAVPYTLEGNRLTMESKGTEMVFEKK